MYLYATSKNSGPSYSSDPLYLSYLGTSPDEAIEAVGEFSRFERKMDVFPEDFVYRYSALPRNRLEWKPFRFYFADGWWYSIVRVELK